MLATGIDKHKSSLTIVLKSKMDFPCIPVSGLYKGLIQEHYYKFFHTFQWLSSWKFATFPYKYLTIKYSLSKNHYYFDSGF